MPMRARILTQSRQSVTFIIFIITTILCTFGAYYISLSLYNGENERDSRLFVLQQLSNQIETLKNDARETRTAYDDAKADFEKSNANQSMSVTKERMDSLNGQLIPLQNEIGRTITEMESIDSAIKTNTIIENPLFTDVGVFENMRAIKAEIRSEIETLLKNPEKNKEKIAGLRKELENIENLSLAAMADYADLLHSKVTIEKSEIDTIEAELAILHREYEAYLDRREMLNKLKEQADKAETLLVELRQTYFNNLQSINENNSRNAIAHKLFHAPQRMTFIILLIGSCVLLILVYLYYSRQNDFKRAALEKETGFQIYGVIPKVKFTDSQTAIQYLNHNPSSPLAEALRTFYINMNLRDPIKKAGARVVTFTATVKGEGTSTNAVWLAHMAAQNGQKTLIIDANMRDPALHKIYKIGNAKGVADYLSDRLPLDETIYTKHPSGVHLMTGKAIPTHALVLLTVDRMDIMIRRLSDRYDLIIIDAPEAKTFSDASVISRLSDKIFYCVNAQSMDLKNIKTAIKQFTDMNFTDIALFINKSKS